VARLPLRVPTFVNYSCRLCGWCCHQYEITVSREDRERLSAHDWAKLEPELAGKELFAPLRDRRTPDLYRLRYTPEGACVFLSRENACLMHSHVGELGKPLGCCVFPLTFADSPTGVYVGCRFSCMAVAYGLGEPLPRRKEFMRQQLDLVEKAGQLPRYPDVVTAARGKFLPWEDYIRLEEMVIRILLREDVPLLHRLLALHRTIEILRRAKFERLRGERLKELLRILEMGLPDEAAREELPRRPDAMQRMIFRQFCFLFQNRHGGAYRELGLAGKLRARLANLARSVRFSFNTGRVQIPAFPGEFSLAATSGVPPPSLGPNGELALSRFLAAKIFGKQHFGPLFFRYSVADGLTFLLLAAGAVLWYARARALARGARAPEHEDVIEAIRYVDFCYGFSPAPGLIVERIRVKLLGHGDAAARLAVDQLMGPNP